MSKIKGLILYALAVQKFLFILINLGCLLFILAIVLISMAKGWLYGVTWVTNLILTITAFYFISNLANKVWPEDIIEIEFKRKNVRAWFVSCILTYIVWLGLSNLHNIILAPELVANWPWNIVAPMISFAVFLAIIGSIAASELIWRKRKVGQLFMGKFNPNEVERGNKEKQEQAKT